MRPPENLKVIGQILSLSDTGVITRPRSATVRKCMRVLSRSWPKLMRQA